jgi:hypothetical protein
MVSYTLGPDIRKPINGCPGFYMRVDDDIRKTVVFIATRTGPGEDDLFIGGTGFLLRFDGSGYLITARHIAKALEGGAFVVRMNTREGAAHNWDVDDIRWFHHPDPTVDLAVIPFDLDVSSPYNTLYLDQSLLARDSEVQNDGVTPALAIGVGDLTYTVGLFRLMTGKKKNLPVVHMGSIAMVPRDELIPCKDWDKPGNTISVEGYLVETQALDGLSGSPVFTRQSRGMLYGKPSYCGDS